MEEIRDSDPLREREWSSSSCSTTWLIKGVIWCVEKWENVDWVFPHSGSLSPDRESQSATSSSSTGAALVSWVTRQQLSLEAKVSPVGCRRETSL